MPSDFRWHSILVSADYLPDTEFFNLVQAKKNPKLYWMIPISSQAEKYKGIIEKKKKKYGKCNTIVIGLFAGKENAFLIQNTFPVIENILTIYIRFRNSQ